jgi:HPt (histidine-containing phosphotransfer) domain-containing protein
LSEVSTADAAVRSRLAELTRKFVTRTRDDVAQMRDGLARLEVSDVSALAQIHQLAHRACGTGGTLGLCALSDAAAALERLVEACPADALPDAAVRAEIAAAIDAIAEHCVP